MNKSSCQILVFPRPESVKKQDKLRILNLYLDKLISADEMEIWLKLGNHI